MNKMNFLVLIFVLMSFTSCKKEQNITTEAFVEQTSEGKTDLSAQEFSDKIKQNPDAIILDVRTPQEFERGHIANAMNVNSAENFEGGISQLDKSKSVFVYCLSGARSSYTIDVLKNAGFKNVYHLHGGLMDWRSANLPETTDKNIANKGMTRSDYDKMLQSDKMVLVDFYADWCAPCKKMEPYLKEISETMSDKVKVVRIDADANAELCKELKISPIPVLHLYRSNKLVWENTGFVPKETVVEKN